MNLAEEMVWPPKRAHEFQMGQTLTLSGCRRPQWKDSIVDTNFLPHLASLRYELSS